MLKQSGNDLTGTYTHEEGILQGTISGNKFIGTWAEIPSRSPPDDAGDVEFTLSDDCSSFSGTWLYGSSGNVHDVDGHRTG